MAMTNNAVSEARRAEARPYKRHTAGELAVEPLSEALPRWRAPFQAMDGATLYHREPWLGALERAHRLELSVAMLSADGRGTAGCVFTRSAHPPRPRMVSLSFSDFCPPLSLDDEARELPLNASGAHPPAPRLWRNLHAPLTRLVGVSLQRFLA